MALKNYYDFETDVIGDIPFAYEGPGGPGAPAWAIDDTTPTITGAKSLKSPTSVGEGVYIAELVNVDCKAGPISFKSRVTDLYLVSFGDDFQFYVDGVMQYRAGASQYGVTFHTSTVAAGLHTFTFIYIRSGIGSSDVTRKVAIDELAIPIFEILDVTWDGSGGGVSGGQGVIKPPEGTLMASGGAVAGGKSRFGYVSAGGLLLDKDVLSTTFTMTPSNKTFTRTEV